MGRAESWLLQPGIAWEGGAEGLGSAGGWKTLGAVGGQAAPGQWWLHGTAVSLGRGAVWELVGPLVFVFLTLAWWGEEHLPSPQHRTVSPRSPAGTSVLLGAGLEDGPHGWSLPAGRWGEHQVPTAARQAAGSPRHGVACRGLGPGAGMRQPGSGTRVTLVLRRAAGSARPARGVGGAAGRGPLGGKRSLGRMRPRHGWQTRALSRVGRGVGALPRGRGCPGRLQRCQPVCDSCWLRALAVPRRGSLLRGRPCQPGRARAFPGAAVAQLKQSLCFHQGEMTLIFHFGGFFWFLFFFLLWLPGQLIGWAQRWLSRLFVWPMEAQPVSQRALWLLRHVEVLCTLDRVELMHGRYSLLLLGVIPSTGTTAVASCQHPAPPVPHQELVKCAAWMEIFRLLILKIKCWGRHHVPKGWLLPVSL